MRGGGNLNRTEREGFTGKVLNKDTRKAWNEPGVYLVVALLKMRNQHQ